jgi:hypothetical protein
MERLPKQRLPRVYVLATAVVTAVALVVGCSSSSGGGGGGGGGGASDAGGLPFGSACTSNAQCTSNDCFNFNARGMFCTEPCTPPGMSCPNGGLGCNGMGQCKVP